MATPWTGLSSCASNRSTGDLTPPFPAQTVATGPGGGAVSYEPGTPVTPPLEQ